MVTTPPHAEGIDSLRTRLGATDAGGLSAAEAHARLQRDGPNELDEAKPRSPWRILAAQFFSIVMALLVAAAAVSLAVGDLLEAAAITVLIVINVVIGFAMEFRADREMLALQRMGSPTAHVRRDGQDQRVPAPSLVVGDTIILTAGDVISADARITNAAALSMDESTFTGESTPVDKELEAVASDAPIHAHTNMVYRGSRVLQGSGDAIVVATGERTQLGAIATMTRQAEPKATPLERRLARLGKALVVAALGIAGLVTLVGIARGIPTELMVETGIALAVAAVPEGLPVVATLALARGMIRMAQSNAVVRNLPAVETLGSTDILCVDKTGTLTENRMELATFALWSGSDIADVDPQADHDTAAAIRTTIVLCNDAQLDPADGDPMEVALLEGVSENAAFVARLREENPRLHEWPFDPTTRLMATEHADGIAVKGAPEAILERCTTVLHDQHPIPLDAAHKATFAQANDAMAGRGLRVLGVARADPGAKHNERLTLLGLIGLRDPPRPEAKAAIAQCQAAGVDVVMVTGDQMGTAQAIGAELGIHAAHAVDGADVSTPLPTGVRVFSRVNPGQKLAIVAAFQDKHHIVAMTGDGVNDAPALRQADIGIAMGQRGTDVAREASDIVLRDDALPTIVTAIQLGRATFENLRRFAYYLLSCNVGEVAIVTLAALLGGGLPLLPLQILFLNFVTDVFPALALGFGEGDKHLMKQKPRPAHENILTRRHWRGILAYGGVFSASVLGAFWLAREWLALAPREVLTVSFSALAFGQLWHVFNMRDPATPIWQSDLVRNPYLWGALALSSVFILLAIHLGPLAAVLQLTPLSGRAWALVLVASLVPLLAGQAALVWRESRRRATASQHETGRAQT